MYTNEIEFRISKINSVSREKYNNFSINISCLTIDKITIALSNFSLAKKNLEIPPHINSMCKK